MKKNLLNILICGLSITLVGCNTNKTFIGYDEAEKICKKATENGEIIKSYKTKDDSKDIYEIEVLTKDTVYSCDINAVDGKLLKKESEKVYNTLRDYKEALKVAKDYTQATKVINVADDENGFEIELQDEMYRYDIEIDVNNEIISGESEVVEIR